MVVFVTLFLALTAGVEPVSLAVEEPVARVELRLDGHAVAELTGSPWATEIDFGPLAPHRLEAVGFDAAGNEVTRAEQSVNVSRSRAEARILLHHDSVGYPRRAQVVWDTVERRKLTSLELRFDGEPLPVEHPRGEVQLPRYAPDQQHFLVAELLFEDGLRAEAAVGFGARLGGRVRTELTALVMRRKKGRRLPPPSEMEGWFLHGRLPVRVQAVDRNEGSDVYLLRQGAAFQGLHAFSRTNFLPPLEGPTGSGPLEPFPEDVRFPEDRVFLLHPVPDLGQSQAAGTLLFPISQPTARKGIGAIAWVLGQLGFPDAAAEPERIVDAVTVAARTAAQGRSRAVVAVLHPAAEDHSRATWAEARAYAAALGVPLHLWSPLPGWKMRERQEPIWEQVQTISTTGAYQTALRDLRRDLASQVVVWVEGSFLPGEVELGDEASAWLEWVR